MKTFSELVVEGPFILVKGFLMGFWGSREPPPRYFIHRKVGIRRETLRDVLVELFELENLVHLCLEDEAVPAFRDAVEKAHPVIGISLKSTQKIAGAEFGFSFEIFNRDLADECKAVLSAVPEGVELIDFDQHEEVRKEAGAPSLSGYGSAHPYEYRGQGQVKGDFGGVVDLYLKCKRSKACPSILTREIGLALEE